MTMQYDVKSAYAGSFPAQIYTGRTRLKSIVFIGNGTGGTFTMYDGTDTTGPIIYQFKYATAVQPFQVLVPGEGILCQNGVYVVTAVGSVTVPWVLTRAADYDGSIRTPFQGDFIGVVEGATNALTFWFETAPSPITIGTSAITWAEGTGETGAAFTWETVSGTSQTVADQTGYIPLNGSLTTFTLPLTAPVGFNFAIEGLGNGGWTVQANGGQYIRFLSTVTNSGGTASSAFQYDGCHIVCITANTEFKIITAGSSGLVLD